jgi:hypothetical protein
LANVAAFNFCHTANYLNSKFTPNKYGKNKGMLLQSIEEIE